LKKLTRRGGQSLEMKKLKEEEACVEKVLALLQGGGDVRKGDWSAKEVRTHNFFLTKTPKFPDDKRPRGLIIPARRMPQHKRREHYEI
jgi:hypothetical protein